VYCDHSALLVMLSQSQVQLAVESLMAWAQVIAMASGADCLVAGSAETPCHGLEAVCLIDEPVEVPCLDWEAVCSIAGLAVAGLVGMQCLGLEPVGVVVEPVEMPCRDLQAAEAAGDIERASA